MATFVLLTEDGSEYAGKTLRRVALHLLQAIRATLQTQRLRFEPGDKQQRPMLSGNNWKSTSVRDEPKVRDLCQWIATQLSRLENEATRFVLFHYDGDRKWSERDSSENAEKFAKVIRAKVRLALAAPPQRLAPQRKGLPASKATAKSPEHIDLLLRRLIEVVPFYSIESWLFRNVAIAKAHCAQTCGGGHVALLEAWQRGQPSLDEVLKPKEALCFGDQANAELAGPGFPADDLYLAETSFYETVERLRQSPGLLEALEQTEQH